MPGLADAAMGSGGRGIRAQVCDARSGNAWRRSPRPPWVPAAACAAPRWACVCQMVGQGRSGRGGSVRVWVRTMHHHHEAARRRGVEGGSRPFRGGGRFRDARGHAGRLLRRCRGGGGGGAAWGLCVARGGRAWLFPGGWALIRVLLRKQCGSRATMTRHHRQVIVAIAVLMSPSHLSDLVELTPALERGKGGFRGRHAFRTWADPFGCVRCRVA